MTDEVWFQKEWTFESRLGQEKRLMSKLQTTFQELLPEEPRIDEMMTAVSEACLNAMEHGNQFVQHLPVNVTLLIQADRTTFRITDEGNGTSLENISTVSQVEHKIGWDNPRGWGLQLMSHYADSLCTARYKGKFCIEMQFLRKGLKGEGMD